MVSLNRQSLTLSDHHSPDVLERETSPWFLSLPHFPCQHTKAINITATSVLGVFSCRVSRNPYIAGGELLQELRSHPGNEQVEVRAFLVAGSSTCCTAGDTEQSQ